MNSTVPACAQRLGGSQCASRCSARNPCRWRTGRTVLPGAAQLQLGRGRVGAST